MPNQSLKQTSTPECDVDDVDDDGGDEDEYDADMPLPLPLALLIGAGSTGGSMEDRDARITAAIEWTEKFKSEAIPDRSFEEQNQFFAQADAAFAALKGAAPEQARRGSVIPWFQGRTRRCTTHSETAQPPTLHRTPLTQALTRARTSARTPCRTRATARARTRASSRVLRPNFNVCAVCFGVLDDDDDDDCEVQELTPAKHSATNRLIGWRHGGV